MTGCLKGKSVYRQVVERGKTECGSNWDTLQDKLFSAFYSVLQKKSGASSFWMCSVCIRQARCWIAKFRTFQRMLETVPPRCVCVCVCVCLCVFAVSAALWRALWSTLTPPVPLFNPCSTTSSNHCVAAPLNCLYYCIHVSHSCVILYRPKLQKYITKGTSENKANQRGNLVSRKSIFISPHWHFSLSGQRFYNIVKDKMTWLIVFFFFKSRHSLATFSQTNSCFFYFLFLPSQNS